VTERWTDERLDRLATVTDERLSRIEVIVESNTHGIEANRQFNENLGNSMAQLVQIVSTMVQTQTDILQRIDEMQAEVRGLQTENRRILDRVFGQEGA
jgi:hypothetical protein